MLYVNSKIEKNLPLNTTASQRAPPIDPVLQVYDFRRLAVFCFGVTSAWGGPLGESIRNQGLHRGVGPARRER